MTTKTTAVAASQPNAPNLSVLAPGRFNGRQVTVTIQADHRLGSLFLGLACLVTSGYLIYHLVQLIAQFNVAAPKTGHDSKILDLMGSMVGGTITFCSGIGLLGRWLDRRSGSSTILDTSSISGAKMGSKDLNDHRDVYLQLFVDLEGHPATIAHPVAMDRLLLYYKMLRKHQELRQGVNRAAAVGGKEWRDAVHIYLSHACEGLHPHTDQWPQLNKAQVIDSFERQYAQFHLFIETARLVALQQNKWKEFLTIIETGYCMNERCRGLQDFIQAADGLDLVDIDPKMNNTTIVFWFLQNYRAKLKGEKKEMTLAATFAYLARKTQGISAKDGVITHVQIADVLKGLCIWENEEVDALVTSASLPAQSGSTTT